MFDDILRKRGIKRGIWEEPEVKSRCSTIYEIRIIRRCVCVARKASEKLTQLADIGKLLELEGCDSVVGCKKFVIRQQRSASCFAVEYNSLFHL
jgi:hypothetical protein